MGVLFLVRHGQASFGASDYDVLSTSGRLQSVELGRWLSARGVRAEVVVHGGMRRQRETAEELVAAAGWAVAPSVDEGWSEFDHLGVVASYLAARPEEGTPASGRPLEQDRRAFQQVFLAAVARWAAGEPGEYTESYRGFVERVHDGLLRAASSAGPGGTVVVVTSGGPIAAAVAGLLLTESSPAERVPVWQRLNTVVVNASYSRVIVGSSGARLLTFNEHPHLGPDLLTYR